MFLNKLTQLTSLRITDSGLGACQLKEATGLIGSSELIAEAQGRAPQPFLEHFLVSMALHVSCMGPYEESFSGR